MIARIRRDPLVINPMGLVFFVDETGHEFFADTQYPVFGLGGCAMVAGAMDAEIRSPWRAVKALHFGGANVPLHAADNGETSKAHLERRLKKIQASWDELQATRARDAVYGYLAQVFSIVAHYKVRRKTKKLLQGVFELADLPMDRRADPFTAVIRCTSDDAVDSKTVSKWARALRYVAYCKPPKMRVETFMKKVGGINACADLYARYFGRRSR